MSKSSSRSAFDGANNERPAAGKQPDLLCFSHLRWDFVYQRPQHLLSRASAERRVFFWEEPLLDGEGRPSLSTAMRGRVCVVQPHLPEGVTREQSEVELRRLLDAFLREEGTHGFLAWYYTPMALGFTSHLQPVVTVYDCMDELSAFQGAPPDLRAREAELFQRADLVFTGGRSLYEGKRTAHPDVYLFPSSIDRTHFERARERQPDPADQSSIPRPRIGFFGVLDERLDRTLLAEVAALRPGFHFVLIGPVAKIRREELPSAENLHYLGQKSYAELPAYVAGWDAAILPFAINAATAYISPTKTPEYLAAGCRVVSTPIRDVVADYGDAGLVEIAGDSEAFARALDAAIEPGTAEWQAAVEHKLGEDSWDATWSRMSRLVAGVFANRSAMAVPGV